MRFIMSHSDSFYYEVIMNPSPNEYFFSIERKKAQLQDVAGTGKWWRKVKYSYLENYWSTLPHLADLYSTENIVITGSRYNMESIRFRFNLEYWGYSLSDLRIELAQSCTCVRNGVINWNNYS